MKISEQGMSLDATKGDFVYPWRRVGDVESESYFKAVSSPSCTRDDIVSQARAVAHARGWVMEDEQ